MIVRISLALLIIGCAVALRLSLFPYWTADTTAVAGWLQYIHGHGGLFALRDNFSDYNVPYLYLLVALSATPLDSTVAENLLSVGFDFGLATFAYLIVALRYRNPWLPLPSALPASTGVCKSVTAIGA
jgi:hypothetical protein